MYSKSEYTRESVSVSVRPAVYTITPEKLIRLFLKFCTQHYLIHTSVEFEDENNSSRIYWVTARNIIIFYSFLCKYWPIPIFANQNFCQSQNETSTIKYHSIENFMGYKMMLTCMGKYAVLKISSILQYPKTMKNSRILALCLYEMCLLPIELTLFFWSR